MKRLLPFLFSCFAFLLAGAQQDEQPGKLRDKMVEYIQTRLGLEKAEAERFQPVFLDYLRDLHKTNKEFRGDRLVLQQKVVELRLRYREQFKPILGDKRSNDVFRYERDFVDNVRDVLRERRQERTDRRSGQRKNAKLLPN